MQKFARLVCADQRMFVYHVCNLPMRLLRKPGSVYLAVDGQVVYAFHIIEPLSLFPCIDVIDSSALHITATVKQATKCEGSGGWPV